ncbi:MAG: YcbK family protein [Candidatus Eremiobacteraeota bacterium]|nr:YcbK family protein [Candidatus Eremiobacteraeota bacterium]MBC5827876.1 YcbK family protein [Candidatus Eremiobacteraeota bacterium]
MRQVTFDRSPSPHGDRADTMNMSTCCKPGATLLGKAALAVTRSGFLAGGFSTLALLATPGLAFGGSAVRSFGSPYVLWLERMGTRERVAAPFTLDGKALYAPGYAALCAILRDEHVPPSEGDVQISVVTLEALWAVQRYLARAGVREPIVVHSGYRTPETNARTEGAAKASYHMSGMAVDFHVGDLDIGYLASVCWSCPISGGVGYYPQGWVHLDTGPKRFWNG